MSITADFTWTEERVAQLTQRWGDGVSASLIAEEFGEGLSRNAVCGKLHRLGLGRLRGAVSGRTVTQRPRGYRSHQQPRQAVVARGERHVQGGQPAHVAGSAELQAEPRRAQGLRGQQRGGGRRVAQAGGHVQRRAAAAHERAAVETTQRRDIGRGAARQQHSHCGEQGQNDARSGACAGRVQGSWIPGRGSWAACAAAAAPAHPSRRCRR